MPSDGTQLGEALTAYTATVDTLLASATTSKKV
jgi:hypothetical protein